MYFGNILFKYNQANQKAKIIGYTKWNYLLIQFKMKSIMVVAQNISNLYKNRYFNHKLNYLVYIS